MKKITLGVMAAALSLLILSIPLGAAEQKEAPKVPQIEMSHVVTTTAKVGAVNEANRTVTLQGPENTIAVKVEEWVDLGKVKSGDSIDVIYFESLVAEIYKIGEKPPVSGVQTIKYINGSASGEKPVAAAARETILKGTVQSIDTGNRIVVIEDPDGNLKAHKVKDPRNMDKIEEGDTVVIGLIQAVAISVEKSSGKEK
jgi:hypothetical protein